MAFWSRITQWIQRWRRRSGVQPHPRMRCPACGSRYVRSSYSNRFECCDCGKVFS